MIQVTLGIEKHNETRFFNELLKHPHEVRTLRRIYGPAFFLVAAYSPRPTRLLNLAKRLAGFHYEIQLTKFIPAAEGLLQRDQVEADDPFGQDVQDAFPLADAIINTNDPTSMGASIDRFVELIFGNTFHTPTKDEQGMYYAQAAALRSSSLSRQVGAVITREDGTPISVGTNEVPKYGGGYYWSEDESDARDFRGERDSSDLMKENVLADVLERLRQAGWLAEEKRNIPIMGLVEEALKGEARSIMKGAHFTHTIDYVRAVHAEMAALIDAVRFGVAIKGCSLYTTTFPCHDCAKHILAAGIERVVYVEPYPKSIVQELYPESVLVDSNSDCPGKLRFDPFVGVTPRRYSELFSMGGKRRKSPEGNVLRWTKADAAPKSAEYMPLAVATLVAENRELKVLSDMMQETILK